jgi:hypothetical protein
MSQKSRFTSETHPPYLTQALKICKLFSMKNMVTTKSLPAVISTSASSVHHIFQPNRNSVNTGIVSDQFAPANNFDNSFFSINKIQNSSIDKLNHLNRL